MRRRRLPDAQLHVLHQPHTYRQGNSPALHDYPGSGSTPNNTSGTNRGSDGSEPGGDGGGYSAGGSGGGHQDCGWNPLCYGKEAGGYLWAHKAQIAGAVAGGVAGGLCYAASGATAEEGVGIALATQCGAFAGAVGSYTENAVNPHGDHSAAGTASAIVSGGVVGGATGGLAEGAGQFLADRFDEGTLANSLGKVLSGSPGCNSFTATTVVEMANGTKKAISAVTTGQTVLATDPLTGKTKPEKVTATIITKGDTDFTNLTVHTAHGDSTITSTQHHPYWDITRHRWVNAGDLHIGEHLRDVNGGAVTVARVRNYVTHLPTYNLTVNELHTYYALAGETPVLVHNSSCPVPISKGRWDHIWDRHVVRVGEFPNKSKFLTTSKAKIQKMINRALDGQTGDGAYYYKFPNPIGRNGAGDDQYYIRVVVRDRKLITAFPSEGPE
ncbi:polymorphic toxin-type HINT domain-containing protein [Streptomyces sp. NPDC002573]|uniref:polymorphic toxin-type HINT domain-containing protein n=1 Tax=Streptomyces sp. NPDC002573 TaxID=3364651 RepID=UPI0036D0DEA1